MNTIIDIFQRFSERPDWDNTADTPDGKDVEKHVWNEVMKQVQEPFEILSEAVDQGLEHAAMCLEIIPRSKKAASKGNKSVLSPFDVDLEAGQEPKPGDPGFARVLDDKVQAFYSRKGELLRKWVEERGISLDEETSDHPYFRSERDQVQLYIILYMENLMHAAGEAVQDLVDFADEKVEDGTMSKKRLIAPTLRRLHKWFLAVLSHEDSSAEQNPDAMEAGANLVFFGDNYNRKSDPEHLPPETTWEHLGNGLRKITKFFGSEESAFGFRVACATMTIGVVAFLERSQTFFMEQRLVWALIIITIGMTMSECSFPRSPSPSFFPVFSTSVLSYHLCIFCFFPLLSFFFLPFSFRVLDNLPYTPSTYLSLVLTATHSFWPIFLRLPLQNRRHHHRHVSLTHHMVHRRWPGPWSHRLPVAFHIHQLLLLHQVPALPPCRLDHCYHTGPHRWLRASSARHWQGGCGADRPAILSVSCSRLVGSPKTSYLTRSYRTYLIAPYRVACVAGGSLVAFFWTVFPSPLTDRTWLRRDLSATLYLLANYFGVISSTLKSNVDGTAGDVNVPGTPAHQLFKVGRKIFGKVMMLIPSMSQHSEWQKWEPTVGGKFPREAYENIIKRSTRIMAYLTLTSYTLMHPTRVRLSDRGDDEERRPRRSHLRGASLSLHTRSRAPSASTTHREWMTALSGMLEVLKPTHHTILSTLTLLSNSLLSGQSLPPFLPLPRPYEMTRQMMRMRRSAHSAHSAADTDADDDDDMSDGAPIRMVDTRTGYDDYTTHRRHSEVRRDAAVANILDPRNIEQPGYAEFAVLQICTTLVCDDLEGLLRAVSGLVGVVDFCFDFRGSDSSLDLGRRDGKRKLH
jgi:hypothetical protein